MTHFVGSEAVGVQSWTGFCRGRRPSDPILVPIGGSQDSLLEITFRSGGLPVICDPSTPKPEQLVLPPPGTGLDPPPPVSPLGRRERWVRLECFRFPVARDSPGDCQHPLPGGLELFKFRESGIASECEDESITESEEEEEEDHGAWSPERLPRLLHVLPRQELGDGLDDEVAV